MQDQFKSQEDNLDEEEREDHFSNLNELLSTIKRDIN